MKRIGVTGYKGRLGSELIRQGCLPLDCDVISTGDISRVIQQVNPQIIINCAAKTDVDACEEKKYYNKAVSVNFRGATNIQDVFDGWLIHISTDYVFDCKGGPYSETDELKNRPVNSYGITKFGAEKGLTSIFPHIKTTIVRTTGLYGNDGHPDFVRFLLHFLRNGWVLPVTNELRGNQTYIPHLAEAIMKLTELTDVPEWVHIASKEADISRYEFAVEIARVFGLPKELLEPCKNSEVPDWKANRPTTGGLKTDLAESLGLPIYTIEEGLNDLKNRL